MVAEIDVWRVAQQLWESKGKGAEAGAAQYLKHCRRGGATDGVTFWLRVTDAITRLRDVRPPTLAH